MASSSRAMPKSVRHTSPSVDTRMFAGFTSRWMTPREWACSSASATAAIARTACSSVSSERSNRSPTTSSEIRYALSSSDSTPTTVWILGCVSLEAVRASRSARAASPSLRRNTLTATAPLPPESRPEYTDPNPPLPSISCSS